MSRPCQQRDPAPISSIVEADLRRSNGELLGVVDELLIDLRSGRLEYVLATSPRGERLRFPWSSITVSNGTFVVDGDSPRLVVSRDGRKRR